MQKRLSNSILERIETRFQRLYPEQWEGLMERLLYTVGRYGVGTPPAENPGGPDEKEVVLITYADSIRVASAEHLELPLVTLRRFCREHLRGAISTVHLLPFYPWSSDDGFSVIDYRVVDPPLGAWQEVEDLGQEFSLMFDLVLNHCSSESTWFSEFVAGVQPGRHYFLQMDPETDLSAVVRPRTSPLLTETPTRDGPAFVWTTFSTDQVDLNWQNPDLLFEFIDILFLYIARGVRILRLDAVAFLWKKIGTSCVHLPETHEVVKLFRDICELVAPQVLLLTETNVPQPENISYFGEGDEAHMVYNFSLPPLLLHGLLRGDASYLTDWAASLPPPPAGCHFFNFSSSHDGIGVRPLHGLLERAELDFLVEAVQDREGRVNFRTGADGREEPYELNITYFSALSEPGDPDLGRARFLCSQAVVLALQGVPAVYIHCLTGSGNDLEGLAATGHNRAINRKKWDRDELGRALADHQSEHAKVFNAYRALLKKRVKQKAFHPEAAQEVLNLDKRIFGVVRTSPDEAQTLICLYNFSGEPVSIKPFPQAQAGMKGVFQDVVTGKSLTTAKKGVTLAPYQFAWLSPR